MICVFFFFNDTATTEIYTLSLHDALPISITTRAERQGAHYVLNGVKQFITSGKNADIAVVFAVTDKAAGKRGISAFVVPRSEEHTSELQSQSNLVCRLLLDKKSLLSSCRN